MPVQRWQLVAHLPQRLGQQLVDADLLEQPVESRPLHKASRRQGETIATCVRKDVLEDETLKPRDRLLTRYELVELRPKRLEHLVVLHPGRAGRLARPAVQAQVEVLTDSRVRC